MEQQEEQKTFEGAGFLLYHNKKFILGIRIKKPEDAAKNPVVEVEYMGGKAEPVDNNEWLRIAFNELLEEVGSAFLETEWEKRVVPIHTFQQFSKKWIGCALLKLTDSEYRSLVQRDSVHDQIWLIGETRTFSSITSRPEPARKAVSAFVQVNAKELVDYMKGFKAVPNSGNRMNDAKAYGKNATLNVTRLSTGEASKHPLQGFNAVIFEEHVKTIIDNIF